MTSARARAWPSGCAGRVTKSSPSSRRRGADDDSIIGRASAEGWIWITNDRDFGEKVFRERRPHRGVIFMRLEDERAANKIRVLRSLIEKFGDRLADQFVVVTESRVRFARPQS